MAEQNLGGIAWTVDADTSGAVNSTKQFDAQVTKVENSLKGVDAQVSKTAKSVNASMRTMGQRAGQASIQLQQLIGQIQGGQNVSAALSAQMADLGFVLGAPLLGAVGGIAASLVGMLIPALVGSSEQTEELTDKIKELVKASTLTEAQSAFLVNQTNDEIDANQELIKESNERIRLLQRTVDNYDRYQKKLDEGIKLTHAERNSYKLLGDDIDQTRRKLTQETAARDTLDSTVDDLIKKRAAYTLATEKSIKEQESETKGAVKLQTALERLQQQLTDQAATLGMSNREVAHYKASLIGATDEMHRQIDAIYDHQEALKFEQEQLKANTEEEKRRLAKMKEVAAWQAQRRAEAAEFAGGIAGRGMTEGDIRAQENARLDELRQQDLISEQEYNDAKIQMNREYAQAVQAVNSMVLSSVSSLTSDLMANMDEQSGAYKALFAIQKAAAVAQAIVAAELAANQVMAHDAGILGFGALATSNIVRGMGYASAGIIAGTSIAGGREHGGSMLAGSTYEVGEKNKPELLMIPGNNGKMFSNAEVKGMMSGGSGGINQTINNYAAADGYQVRTSGDGVTTQQVIEIIRAESANPNSHMRRNLTSGTNIQNTISGGRR